MQNMCSLFLMSIWTGKQYITKQLSFVKTVHHFVYHTRNRIPQSYLNQWLIELSDNLLAT